MSPARQRLSFNPGEPGILMAERILLPGPHIPLILEYRPFLGPYYRAQSSAGTNIK